MKTATTAVKLCRVMEQFQEHQSFGITDLARRTELLPSDVHRLLASLRTFGYVEQDPETRKYRLGFSLIRLAALQWDLLCERAHPALARLSQTTAAETWLALLDRRQTKVFLVDQATGPDRLVFAEEHLGGLAPLHCTALGKTIAANLSPGVACSALEKRGLAKYTRFTITDQPTLQEQFQEIRRLGYAVDREEYISGVCCLASPLLDGTGSLVGAISTSMPSSRFLAWEESRLGAHVKAAAVQVSSALGASRAGAM
jgi:IclR family transcriptional regulator, KDG regulon repressor